jgi:hypothetical protein
MMERVIDRPRPALLAAFASGWIGPIEPVEDLANVLRIDGYSAVTYG